MVEKSEIDVDEDGMMRFMAADIPIYKAQSGDEEKKPEMQKDESMRDETVEPVKPVKRKNARQTDFEGTFLKEAKIKDRRQMYISGEFYDRISAYLRIISDGKVSMVGYIHNVLAHHMVEFRDMINEMYKDKLSKCNPL
jgi:hypothetical protein